MWRDELTATPKLDLAVTGLTCVIAFVCLMAFGLVVVRLA